MEKHSVVRVKDNQFRFTNEVQISGNIKETKEGYLKCENVIMGRSGYQQYLGIELEGMGFNDDEIVEVYRDELEVFAEDTLESARGKPVTEEHPLVDVTIDNIKQLGKGTILTKLKREGNNMVGDIVITDKGLIKLVKNRDKRELSLGYSTKLIKEGNKVYQTNIIINHLAVLQYGRAGNAMIVDSNEKIKEKEGSKVMDKDLLDAISLLKENGASITFDTKKTNDEEEKETKEYQEGDKKEVAKDEEEVKVEVKEKDEETKTYDEDKDEDDKDKEEKDKKKDKKGDEKMNDTQRILNLVADGVITSDEASKLLSKATPSNIFTDNKTVDIKDATKDVNLNDYAGVTGNELNEHLQSIVNDNFGHNKLMRENKTNDGVRGAIQNNFNVTYADFVKKGGNK